MSVREPGSTLQATRPAATGLKSRGRANTFRALLWRTATDLRITLRKAMANEIFTTSKATAYSAILTLFPALLVVTTVVNLLPNKDRLSAAVHSAFDEVLPPDTLDLIKDFFRPHQSHTISVLWSASLITLLAAMGVMLSLIEGFRRAYRLPHSSWGFWKTRVVALALIPICLLPMIFATALVAFGHPIEEWMIANADHVLRHYVLFFWRMVRWAIALTTSIAVLSAIYHFGSPRTRSWRCVLPGATLATFTWFLATLGYGWYVTRFANYTIIYGSLAAVIATLVWLYIASFSVLIGAEFNAQVFPKGHVEVGDQASQRAA